MMLQLNDLTSNESTLCLATFFAYTLYTRYFQKFD